MAAPPGAAAGVGAAASGTAGVVAMAGRNAGTGGLPSAGMLGASGVGAQAGMGGRVSLPMAGAGGALASTGQSSAAGMGSTPADTGVETGRTAGMTAAHNAVRAMVPGSMPLPPMTWSPTLAAFAQEWANTLASTPSTCQYPSHRDGQELQQKGYGENLAVAGSRPARMTTPGYAVDSWAGEVQCWTYGTITDPRSGVGTEKCDSACYMGMNSDGCGHYTQIVWRDTTQLGCGVAACTAGGYTYDIWICNYAPAGNIVGRAPY